MGAAYRNKLENIRLAFPQPVSNHVHDSYFVHSIMRAMDSVDTLKSERPILGGYGELNYDAARKTPFGRLWEKC